MGTEIAKNQHRIYVTLFFFLFLFRKQDLYSMGWADQVDLSRFIVAAAAYGGPIALIRDENKIQKVQGSTKPIIYMFTAAGREMASIRVNINCGH